MGAGLFRFLLTAAALPVCSTFLKGVTLLNLVDALIAGAGLGVVYTVLRPLARRLLLPLSFPVYAAVYVLADAWLFRTAVSILPRSVRLDSFLWAAAAAAVLNAARFLVDAVNGDLSE